MGSDGIEILQETGQLSKSPGLKAKKNDWTQARADPTPTALPTVTFVAIAPD